MDEIFLGRQPILDRNQNLVAYELLFRISEDVKIEVTNNLSATANVIVNTYGALGIDKVLGQKRGFVNVDAELLMSDAVCMLPSKSVVLEILECVEIDDELVQRCIQLKQKGYQLALDDVLEVNRKIEPLLAVVNIVKIDIQAHSNDSLAAVVNELRKWPVILLAEKVESSSEAKQCMDLGFEMFQGFYFAKPEVLTGKRADPAKLSLLNLLTLAMSDCDVEEIEQELKHQPSLSYNLLRMVNSTASGLSKNVESIKQAVMILGRKQLLRWVQLLLYTTNGNNDKMSDAKLQIAATRGKMMELFAVAERPNDKSYQDRAFMVGILSLLDALIGIEMTEIVKTLNIHQEVNDALLARRGRLGLMLRLVEANEKGEVGAVKSCLDELAFLTLGKLTNIELEAIAWSNRIGESA